MEAKTAKCVWIFSPFFSLFSIYKETHELDVWRNRPLAVCVCVQLSFANQYFAHSASVSSPQCRLCCSCDNNHFTTAIYYHINVSLRPAVAAAAAAAARPGPGQTAAASGRKRKILDKQSLLDVKVKHLPCHRFWKNLAAKVKRKKKTTTKKAAAEELNPPVFVHVMRTSSIYYLFPPPLLESVKSGRWIEGTRR